MSRLRTAALLTVATAAVIGAIAPAASAAATPLSKLKSDMGYLKTVESSYSKAHHGKPKTVLLSAGQVTHVGKYRVSARPQEQITVQPGHEGKKLGYCTTIAYAPYHGQALLHFAYYDSILNVTVWKADDYKVGGACLSHAEQQNVITDQMSEDAQSAVDSEQGYNALKHVAYGISFTATYDHPANLPYDDVIYAAYKGDVVRGYANPSRQGYCVTVSNPLAKVAKHSFYYASTTHSSSVPVPVKQGAFGDPKTGSCALPVK